MVKSTAISPLSELAHSYKGLVDLYITLYRDTHKISCSYTHILYKTYCIIRA